MNFPCRVDDGYPCHATGPHGERYDFDDLLFEGTKVGDPVPGDSLNCYPPFGVVVLRPDGLWIEAA